MTDEVVTMEEDGAVEAPVLPVVLAAADVCTWPASYVNCDGECEAYAKFEDPAAAQALFEQAASDLLWNWTGHLFGICPVVIRPCQAGCQDAGWSTYWGRGPLWDPTFPGNGVGPRGAAPWYPVLVSGRWFNMYCGCGAVCSCTPAGPTSLALPGPAQEVTEVLIDGQVLPPTSYRLDRGRWLIRTDGQVWPACQNMLGDPEVDTNTFQVSYLKGIPVPIGGQIALGRLACEMALAACGDEECALPDRIQTLSRQGISMGFEEPPGEPSYTGIRVIDSWIESVTKPAQFASVRSYDTR